MQLARFLAIIAGLSCMQLVYCSKFIQVDPSTNGFVDQNGRHRIFHGVNLVYKVFPYHPNLYEWSPQLSLTYLDMDNLTEWGFNMARVGILWEGVEAVRGQYNVTLLNTIENIVNDLGARGIYSLLDVHQDVYSRYFCGEGVPDWAVQPKNGTRQFPFPFNFNFTYNNSTGYPELEQCLERSFTTYYITWEPAASFQALYDNVEDIQTSFMQFWTVVANRFKSNPFVLGYELINEPLCGDYYRDPLLLLDPGKADLENLQPMYINLNNAIRAVDDEHIIFFEPAISDFFPAGFTQGPGGPAYNNRQALSYHVYCGTANRTGTPRYEFTCDAVDDYYEIFHVKSYKKLGVGGMLTEFGDVTNCSLCLDEINYVTGLSDKNLQGWCYWAFKMFHDITTQGYESFYSPDGALQENKIKALSRTYAQATAGTPTYMNFNPLNGDFTFKYQTNLNAIGPTEIYLNQKYYYPSGYDLSIDPPNSVTVSKGYNKLYLFQTPSIQNGTIITIEISAK